MQGMREMRVWSLGREDPWNRKSNPLLCSCLENPMDRGAWWATAHGAAKSRIRLSDWAQKIHLWQNSKSKPHIPLSTLLTVLCHGHPLTPTRLGVNQSGIRGGNQYLLSSFILSYEFKRERMWPLTCKLKHQEQDFLSSTSISVVPPSQQKNHRTLYWSWVRCLKILPAFWRDREWFLWNQVGSPVCASRRVCQEPRSQLRFHEAKKQDLHQHQDRISHHSVQSGQPAC